MTFKRAIAIGLALAYGVLGVMELCAGLSFIPVFVREPSLFSALIAIAFAAIGGLLCYVVYQIVRNHTEGSLQALSALLGFTVYFLSEQAFARTAFRHAASNTLAHGVSVLLPIPLGYVAYRLAYGWFRKK